MLTTTAALAAHMRRRCTSMARCWWARRNDGRVYGFTSLDIDIVFSGVRYRAATGISPSAISTRAGLQVDNLEAGGFLDSDAITESDLLAGLWDHAQVRIFDVNWRDLSQGQIKLRRGWLGEVTLKDQAYSVEILGLTSALNASIGELVGPSCRAALGDARCKLDLTDYTTTGEVTANDDDRVFDTDLAGATVRLTPTTTGAPTEGYFTDGLLTWLTGLNAGLQMDVRMNTVGGTVELQEPMTRPVAPGDTFSIQAGCVKSIEDCGTRFGNVINFRGWPYLPGIDKVLRFGGQ